MPSTATPSRRPGSARTTRPVAGDECKLDIGRVAGVVQEPVGVIGCGEQGAGQRPGVAAGVTAQHLALDVHRAVEVEDPRPPAGGGRQTRPHSNPLVGVRQPTKRLQIAGEQRLGQHAVRRSAAVAHRRVEALLDEPAIGHQRRPGPLVGVGERGLADPGQEVDGQEAPQR